MCWCRPMGETRGPLANRCLGVLRELLHMLADSWTQLGGEIREFLEGIYRATTAISTMAISELLPQVLSRRRHIMRNIMCYIMHHMHTTVFLAVCQPRGRHTVITVTSTQIER